MGPEYRAFLVQTSDSDGGQRTAFLPDDSEALLVEPDARFFLQSYPCFAWAFTSTTSIEDDDRFTSPMMSEDGLPLPLPLAPVAAWRAEEVGLVPAEPALELTVIGFVPSKMPLELTGGFSAARSLDSCGSAVALGINRALWLFDARRPKPVRTARLPDVLGSLVAAVRLESGALLLVEVRGGGVLLMGLFDDRLETLSDEPLPIAAGSVAVHQGGPPGGVYVIGRRLENGNVAAAFFGVVDGSASMSIREIASSTVGEGAPVQAGIAESAGHILALNSRATQLLRLDHEPSSLTRDEYCPNIQASIELNLGTECVGSFVAMLNNHRGATLVVEDADDSRRIGVVFDAFENAQGVSCPRLTSGRAEVVQRFLEGVVIFSGASVLMASPAGCRLMSDSGLHPTGFTGALQLPTLEQEPVLAPRLALQRSVDQ